MHVSLKKTLISVGAVVIAAAALSACSGGGTNGISAPSNDAEAYERIVACLTNDGWTVEFNEESGGIQSTYPTAQEDAYSAAYTECVEAAGIDQGGELTAEEYKSTYGGLVELRACLIGEGIDLPEAPSYQRFVELKAGWSPYLDIPGETLAQRGPDLESACPQLPVF